MTMPLFLWPSTGLPHVDRAGHWPLDDGNFEHGYLSPTHALHIYDYHAEVRLGAYAVQVQPGDATITPAGLESRYRLQRPGRHWCVHFFPVAPQEPQVSLPVHLRLGPLRHRLVESVRRIAAVLAGPDRHAHPTADAIAAAGMLALLLDLTQVSHDRLASPSAAAGTDPLATAAALIDERLPEALEVGALADEVGLSQNYLARRFRARYGTTLHGYQLRARIDHAQQLLISTDMPIRRIAERLGFSDVQHFNKSFRRLVTTSPSLYRSVGAGHLPPRRS